MCIYMCEHAIMFKIIRHQSTISIGVVDECLFFFTILLIMHSASIKMIITNIQNQGNNRRYKPNDIDVKPQSI